MNGALILSLSSSFYCQTVLVCVAENPWSLQGRPLIMCILHSFTPFRLWRVPASIFFSLCSFVFEVIAINYPPIVCALVVIQLKIQIFNWFKYYSKLCKEIHKIH